MSSVIKDEEEREEKIGRLPNTSVDEEETRGLGSLRMDEEQKDWKFASEEH